ncbi:phospho-N-acetylmuramoyl-pentapeptide-transferase [Candidatus Parcubacteria bacterium]|jgi:phospho-N-acetylmuramoyl-pentapeptide-transferase|nr:MAG: phospho-N-acetylmuramoyl-pentapeptide-transferase [Candidatus Parcubacteria bacterium]
MIEFQPIIRIFFLSALAFVAAMAFTPIWAGILYRYKLRKKIRTFEAAPVFAKFHEKKAGTPTMGGVIIWFTVGCLALLFFIIRQLVPSGFWHELNFLTRQQTWLPLGALIASALVGLTDDYFNVKGWGPKGGGLQVRHKLIIYTAIAIVGAFWFYSKLGFSLIHVPFLGNFEFGWWYIPLFIFIIVSTAFSVNEIDGLDGLSGGTLLAAFGAFGAIAFAQQRYELAALCGVIGGALLAFLWFNIPPARFFMGDTGSISLGVTLGIVAMLTNQALLLPVIGLLFVMESLSVIVQLISKKFFGKKLFLSAPIHHHLEAMGWSESKIVMRFWVIAAVTAIIGLVIFLVDKS